MAISLIGRAEEIARESESAMPSIDDPSAWRGKIISLEEFGADVMRRRAALGYEIDMPRNSGERRTESKRALLEAIAATGKIW